MSLRIRSAKGAAAGRQGGKQLASPLGGALNTATVLRVLLKTSESANHRTALNTVACALILLAVSAGSAAAQFPDLLAFGQQPRIDEFRNSLAPNVGSPDHAIERMLQVANLKPGETLYDLGSGDGRILIAAAKRYKVKGVGIEISSSLAKQSAEEIKKAGLQKSVKIIHGDFMKTDLSEANVVTLYLATTANETLRPNLEHYLRPATRVISYDYPIPGWKAIETSETEGYQGAAHTIYVYQIPASLKK